MPKISPASHSNKRMKGRMLNVALRSTSPILELENISLGNGKDLPKRPRRPQRMRRLCGRLLLQTSPLEDHEVLEVILEPFTRIRKADLVARALLREFGTIDQVLDAAASDLITVAGMEEAGVVALKATAVAAQRVVTKSSLIAPSVRRWSDLSKYVTTLLQNRQAEVLFVIFVDYRGYVIEDSQICSIMFDQRSAYPREVARRCLELNAASIVLVHDHPRGILLSREDKAMAVDIAMAAWRSILPWQRTL
jgi:DNA repair protein RadC